MAQEVIVPVKVQLENLQSIAKDMREQLGTLKINSSGYKKLENVIIDIEKRIQSLQVMSARPFINSKQFSAANKEIIHIHDDLSKIRIEANKIKFSDLSLDSSQKAKLQEFDDELKTINDALKQVKDNAKDTFFSSEIGKAWKIDHPKDVGKSFAEITKIIESEVAKQEGALERAEKAQKDYKERITAQRQLTSFITSGHELSKENLGEKLYNQIFDKNNNFKSGGRTLLQTWLQEQFKLPPSVAEDLVKDAGKKVQEAFALANGNVEKTLKQEKNRIGANLKEEKTNTNNGKTYASNITQATTELNASRAVKQQLSETNLQLAKTEETLGKQYNETKEAREAYTQSCTRQVVGTLQSNAATTAMAGQLQTLQQELDSQQSKIQKYDQAASKLQGISNFINRYVGAYAIIRKVSTAIRNAFTNIQELDKVITSIAVVTNMSQEDLWNKVGQYTDMAQQYGVATKDVYTVSQIFYQQGLQTAQVMDLTTETLKMAKIAGMEYGAAANAMTVAVRAFKIEMSEAQSVTDAYSALAAKFAVSSAEIANAMEKTASSAASVGMSLESTSAFISVMEQTTRESAQNIGSALKSIISRYGEMKASPDKLINVDGEEVAFNKVDTALSSIGISIKDAAGQFRDFDDVIMDLAAKWNTLDNNTQRYIATVMAGNRQQSRFIALVSNYDELNRAMQVASNSENASIVQVAKTMDSLETKTNQLKNAFSQLYLDLHIENGLKNIYDWLTRIITTVGKLGTFNGAIASLANIVGFGTGAKSFIKNIQERVSLRRDAAAQKESELSDKIEKTKLELDTQQAEEQLGEFNQKVSTPVHKEVILDTVNSNTTAIATENNIQNTEAILTNNKDVIINSTNEIQVTANTAQAEEQINNLKTNIETTPIVQPVTLEANQLSDALYKSEFEKNIQDNLKSMPGIGSSLLLEPIDSESFSKMIISALDQFEDARALFSQAGTNAIQDYITAILARGGEVTSAMESIAANAAASIKIQDWFTNTFSNIDFSATAINYEQIIQQAQASLEPLKAEFLTVGSDLGLSLIIGMLGTQGITGQTAVDLAQNILESIRSTLDIHSPSPLIAGMIEEGVGGGIAQGLRSAIGTVTSAAKALGESVMQGIKAGTDSDKHPIISKLLDGKNIRLASSVLRMGGTALAGYGASIQDKSTDTFNGQGIERSKIVTGLGNGLSGAGTGMSLGMMTGNPLVALAGGVVGFLAGGIGAIIDGLHMSLDERLELEKKEAKEKSDAALKEQAKATDISSSIDNIKKLQKAMYNSTEDMQAYKDAMNTLGQSYPELISTYDSMGNAVVDLRAAEETLIAVRAQASDSALEAAEAEMKARHTQSEIWEDSQNKINEILNNPIQHGASAYSRNQPTYQPTDLSDVYTFSSIENISSQGMDKILLELIKNTLNYTDIDKNSDIGKIMTNILQRRIPTIEGAEINPLVSYFLQNLDNQQIWSGPEQQDHFQKFFNAHKVVTGHDNAISNEQAELLYGDTEKLESELNTILTKIAPSLGLSENITARQFFGWDEEGTLKLTQTELEAAKALLDLKISGAQNNTKILDSAVVRGYAEKGLNNALKLSDINTEDKLKISNNSIFTSLITRGLEVAADEAGAESASSWATDPKTKDAFSQARTKLIEKFMTDIQNIDLNKFLAGTSDLTQYLNEDDLFSAAGITDKDSSLAQELVLQFAQDNQANRDRILNTIYDSEGNFNTKALGNIEKLTINSQEAGEVSGDQYAEQIGYYFNEEEPLIITKYADYFTKQLLEIDKLAQQGYTQLASNRLTALDSLAEALSNLDTSKEQQDLFSIITSTDFTNYDSLLNAQKAIEKYRTKNNITAQNDGTAMALQAIIDAQNSLIFNVNTLAENLSSSISGAAKNIDSVLSSNNSGFDLSKALEGLESLNVGKSAEEAFNFNDIFRFDAALGKYVYTTSGLKEAIAQTEGKLNEQVAQLKHMQDLYKTNISSLKVPSDDQIFKDADELISNISGYRNWDQQTQILYEGLAEDFIKASDYTEKTWDQFIKYIEDRKKSGDLAVKATEQQLKAYKANKPNQLFQNIDWAALELGTDYYGTNETLVDALADELQLEGYITQTVLEEYLKTIENVDLREATRTKINDSIIQEKTSQYQNAISELLTYSTDKYLSQATKTAASRLNINLDDLKDNAENATMVASQFLNELAKHIGQAGYTLEQYNQDASSILERTLAQKSKGKALLDFASEDNIGASQLEGLANTLGLKLNQLVDVTSGKAVGIFDKYLNFNANTGAYELQGSFEEFIDVLNVKFGNIIDKTSQTYTETLKSYNEGVIERNNKIKKHVKDEVNAIISAQNGDLIDISWLEREFGAERLNEIFNKYGAILHEGILRLDEDKANIPAMVSELIRELRNASENSVQLTSKELAELQDALDGLLSGAIELITKGASGSLTNVNRNDLVKWAQQNTNVAEALDFTRTTEGIKLTEDSFYKLYKSVKDINVLSAKKLLPTLKNMSKSYETLTGAQKEYREALEKGNDEKASAIADVIGEYLRQSSDAYNLFNGETPLEAQKAKNIIESTAKATQTVTAAQKTGKLGFEDFYGIFGELESQLGSDFELNGKTIADIIGFAPGAYDYDNGAVVDLTQLGFKSAKDWEALKAALLAAAEARKAAGLALEQQAETLNGASKDESIDWDKIFGDEGIDREALKNAIDKSDALRATLDQFVIGDSSLLESFNELPDSLLSSIVARVKQGNFTVAELQDQIIEALGLDAENISLNIDEKGKINLKFEVKDGQIVPSLEVNGRTLTGDALAEYQKIAAENAEKFTTTSTDKGLDVTYRINGYEIHWEYNATTETSTYTCDGISAPTEEELISLLAAFKEKTDNSKPKTASIDGTTRTYVIDGIEYEVIIDGENVTVKGADGKTIDGEVKEKIDTAVKNVKANVSTSDAGADVTTKVDADTKMADEKWSALKKTIEENPVIAQVMANLDPFVSAIEDLKIEKVVPVKYESSGGESEGGSGGESEGGSSQAMGTAFAGGRKGKTLMGELGPEMYVTNGHYYVAGQNGAEMVDLPDDAIVFNHLQTRRLLEKGYGGRGKAVTNERKAAGEAHAFSSYTEANKKRHEAIAQLADPRKLTAEQVSMYKSIKDAAETYMNAYEKANKEYLKTLEAQEQAAEKLDNAAEKQEEAAKKVIIQSQTNTDKMLHDNYGTIRKSVSPEALAKLGLGQSTSGAATASSISRRKSPVTSATLPLGFDLSSIAKSLSGGKGSAGKTEADLIKQAKELQSVIQSVLQDVVSKGFENIDLSTYEKLPEDIKKQMQAYINNSDASYSEFVRAYIDVAGYGIKEGNALIFEAYQKQFENIGTSAEIQSALGELSFFNNGAIAGSDETWTTLFGEYTDVTELIDAGVITYNKELQQWVVTSVEALQQFHTNLDIDEFQDIIVDSLRETSKQMVDLLSKAESGSGTYDDFNKLNAYLKESGLKEISREYLNNTADGLILSYKVLAQKYQEAIDKNLSPETVEQLYDLKIKAIEDNNARIRKDTERSMKFTSGAEKNAVDALTFFANDSFAGTLEQLEALANSSEIDLTNILNNATWDEKLQQFIVSNKSAIEGIDWSTIENLGDMVADDINEFFKNIVDSIKTGLEGGLTNAQATNFKGSLNALGIDTSSLNFEKGLEGLSLSQEAAIHLYNQIKAIDKIQGELVFRELRTSLEESNDKYKTMTSLIVNIVDLQEKINNSDKYNEAKINQYKEELALAKEIAAIRATSEDSSFNFLDQDIPGAMNNPLNYVKNWSNAWNELRDAATDNKAIDFQHFYNVLGEMNNLAQASGQTLNFMGMTLDGSLEAWDAAVNKSIDALGTDADKNYGVLLSKFGDGLTGGADAFAASADGAIHTMAKAQVEILDALIQVFEVIVAMENFEKADINANDLLDFEEIFSDTSNLENAINYTEAYTNVVKELLSKLDQNSDLYAAFDQIKIGGYTLNQIIEDASDGIKDADISSQTLAALMSALYNTLKAGDFDLSNIAESLKTWMLENTEGLSGQIDLGQFVLDFDYNVAITKNVNGTYTTPGGQTFNDFNDAVQAAVQEEIDKNENNTNTAEADAEVKVEANTEEALTNTQKLVSDINDMSATIDVNADVSNALDELSKIVDKLDEISDSTVTIQVENNTSDNSSQATGNVAMAAGTRTLMGELGPELYVSDGRYHVAGENGAEFVNLPKDAIVFNHLQTQRLLSTGSTGRGRAVTSEANAVALAKGGPAAANAQKTLATLKQLRAMWSRLAEASIVDLAGAVNKESSGDKNKVGAWVADVERWYNLLQKIARLEKEINYQEALRSKIEADRVPNGTEYYQSQVDSLKNLREQAATQKLLADSYNDYFETRRKELNESPLSKFYEFNEAGQVQYKEGGLYQLASLFELDDTGKARYTPKQQYDILQSMGLGEYMLRDSNGLAIERDDENIDQFYYDSVQAAYERMTAEQQEMQDLYNNKEDAKVAYLEAITKADKLLQDIIDNQMDMEQKVLDAIETREQKIIDKMTKERQALADSSAKYFEGLEQALSKEREMYSRQQDQDSLAKLQRRLSILQRSGGSASEIASLQQEITDKQRDAYFEAQETAIKEAKDASDLQLEKMQEQIDLMTETLEYEKANGLLWGEVATILSGTSESIMEFITTNMPEWQEKSATAQNEELRTLRNSTQQWVAYYNNGEELVQEMMGGVQESVDGLALTEAKKWNEEILKSSPLQLNYPVLDTQVAEMQALYDNNNSSTQIDKIEYNVNVKEVADAKETERLIQKAMMEGEYPWKNAFKLSPVNNSMSKGRYS